jgi:hypothetical protein
MGDDSMNVRVFCRFRPFNKREIDLGALLSSPRPPSAALIPPCSPYSV